VRTTRRLQVLAVALAACALAGTLVRATTLASKQAAPRATADTSLVGRLAGIWRLDVAASELGKGPYLTNQNEIFDPWGKQYQYDQSGQKNSASGATILIPDVFTTTPDGRMVGNWSDTKK